MLNEFNDQEEIKNNESESYQNQTQFYSRNQKIAVGILAFFGIFVLVLWAVQFNSSLKKPLQHNTAATDSSNSADSTANSASFNADDEALKTKDTDGDGLTDWDEIHIYKTSPYLEDTDGDGYNDKQEIDTNNDPNCPRGQTCNNVSNSTVNSSDKTANTATVNNSSADSQINIITGLNSTSTNLNSLNTGQTSAQSSALLGGKMDAKTLRKNLENSGFDKTLLDQASDAELMDVYNKTLQGSQQNLQ